MAHTATAAMLTSYERKLNVTQTLELATEALSTHRAWLKKRRVHVQVVADDDSAASAATTQEEPDLTWTLGSRPSHHDDAPPLAGENSSRFRSKNRVTPFSVPTEDNKEEAHRIKDISHFFAAQDDDRDNGGGSGLADSAATRQGVTVDKKSARRKMSGSRSRVVPSSHDEETDSPAPIFSPEIFVSPQRNHEKQPPHVPMPRTAWGGGDVSSPDSSHNEPLSSSLTREKTTRKPTIDDDDECDQKAYTLDSRLSNTLGISPVEESSFSDQEPSPVHKQKTTSLSPSPDRSYGEATKEEEQYLESLQTASDSKKTLVAVAPAPRDKRTSYMAHKSSKLTSAEKHGRLYSYNTTATTGEVQSDALILFRTSGSGGDAGTSRERNQSIPEAVLKDVLPKSPGMTVKEADFVTSNFDTLDYKTDAKLDEKDSLREEEEMDDILLQEEVDRINSHMGGMVATKHQREENVELVPVNPSSHALTVARKGHGISFPLEGESSFQKNTTLLPGPGLGSDVVSVHSSTASRVKNGEILKAANLPPLRDVEVTDIYVDGTEMVKTLPPLKLNSPLSPFFSGGKRAHDPPEYTIHRPAGGLALAPPCPLYGQEQEELPDEVPAVKRHSHSEDTDYNATSSANTRNTANRSALFVVRSKSVPEYRPELLSSLDVSREAKDDMAEKKGAAETPQEVASRLNRSSSTLVLSTPANVTEEMLSSTTACSTEQSIPPRSHQREDAQTVAPAMTYPVSISALPKGPTLLHLAAKSGNLRRLQSLLDQGHLVDMPDHEGRTPLMYCIQTQGTHLSCADVLIKSGANLNRQTSDGSTALHMAASIGAVSIIELMLLNGADPDVQDFEGRRPLHWATLQKGTKTFNILLKHSRCTIDCTDDVGMTVLMWAAYNNNPSIVSYLIDQGADVEEKDKDGFTAMHWSVHKDSSHCLQLLLKPDMTYFKDKKGKTVMHEAAYKGSMNACEVILKLRPDAIHDTDKMGHTPLHYAAACSRVDVCALLLDYGADASHKDHTSSTPLDYAREKKLDYVVALLSCHGNAVADFARASRSTSLSSILSRSISFSQLPLQNLDEGTGKFTHLANSTGPSVSKDLNPERENVVNVQEGGYLGRFFPDEPEPIKHYYFRMNKEEGALCWSRSWDSSFKSPSQALIMEVHEGPSNSIKQMPKFSPGDLHCYTFWVVTGGGILDLFAYNEASFKHWLRELGGVAVKNAELAKNGILQQKFKNSSVHSRPASSLGSRPVSRSSVSPLMLSTDNYCSKGSQAGINKTDTSYMFMQASDSSSSTAQRPAHLLLQKDDGNLVKLPRKTNKLPAIDTSRSTPVIPKLVSSPSPNPPTPTRPLMTTHQFTSDNFQPHMNSDYNDTTTTTTYPGIGFTSDDII